MTTTSNKNWRRGEVYRTLCLLWIGTCLWLIGSEFGLFPRLQELTLRYGLSDLVMLGCIMSVALAFAQGLRSVELKRIMAAREEAETQAQSLARHDALTGLANRRRLREAVEASLTSSAPRCAVLLVDLDRFKPVNDVHGHAVGDALLCEVAIRLQDVVPRTGTVARLGGDEFAVLVHGNDKHDLMRLSQQIVTRMHETFQVGGTAVEIGATVGIALGPQDGHDASELLRCADIALYRGKKDGRNTYRFFEQSMDAELRSRALLEAELRSAIASDQIRPHYQPLVSLDDRRLLGFEILARWYHPERGVLSPDLFIDIAEDTGLIAELSYRLLRMACEDARSWPSHLRLALNISSYQLKDRWLPERLLAILGETGFAPHRLEVEITETALASDLPAARAALTSLQNSGVTIALDDFGTGYSSLYHLRELQFDKIKIDRSFVQALNKDGESTKIVDAIINLGKSLGLLTTAEGIENTANLDWLAQQGCSFGQGYLFGEPMSATRVDGLLEDEARAAETAAPGPSPARSIPAAGPLGPTVISVAA